MSGSHLSTFERDSKSHLRVLVAIRNLSGDVCANWRPSCVRIVVAIALHADPHSHAFSVFLVLE